MRWHVGVTWGESDDFEPPHRPGDGRLLVALDAAGSPHRMRERVVDGIVRQLGRPPGPAALDLLSIAMAVYAADLSVPRQLAHDDWTRDIVVHAPVRHLADWEASRPILERVLAFLSGDRWQFAFRAGAPSPIAAMQNTEPAPYDAACLFSGGLDSLVGAIDLLSAGTRVLLVGHYGGGTTSKFQKEVYDGLQQTFGDAALALRFQVLPPRLIREAEDVPQEETQRARSFLFFALGIAAADAVGPSVPLYVPENGLISLNVPMTGARSGSASTRTTHPFYVQRYRELLTALGLEHALVLPYRFRTKAEMLRECRDRALLARLLPLTISCAHPDQRRRRRLSPGGHCGHCFPCLIRRATVAAAGMADAHYDLDVRAEPQGGAAKTGRDLRAVRMALARLARTPSHRLALEVLKSGPIDAAEIGDFAGVYSRGMDELRAYFGDAR